MKSKEEIRNEYKTIRKKITNKKDKSNIILNKIISSNEYKKSRVIAIYNNLKDEVSTKDLISKALEDKKIVCLPKVIKNDMEFIIVCDNTKFVKSKFSILEPTGETISKDLIDLMIVPGICFDNYNNRIGFGKGYYDKYLEGTNIYKIGICFKEQIYEGIIPNSDNDIKVDTIITD